MIRTSAQYRDSIPDGRQVWTSGLRMPDETPHPMFKPIVDACDFERALGYVEQAAHPSNRILAQGTA